MSKKQVNYTMHGTGFDQPVNIYYHDSDDDNDNSNNSNNNDNNNQSQPHIREIQPLRLGFLAETYKSFFGKSKVSLSTVSVCLHYVRNFFHFVCMYVCMYV